LHIQCHFKNILRHALESKPKAIGANFEHFWHFVGPNLLINSRTLTSGINKCWNIGPKGCKLVSQIRWCPFSSLGVNTRL
jgi:hypothetical protein